MTPQIAKYIWFGGSAVVALYLAIANAVFAANLKKTRRKINMNNYPLPVYENGAVLTPCLFGLFRPAIYFTPEALAGEAQNLNKEPDGALTIEQNALDMMSDGTGRTIKQYWLYYDLGLCEYGGAEITPAQLLEFKGADNILKQIGEQDGIIKNILFRANNLININYRASGSVNRYITLNYDFTTMSVSQIAGGEGVYLAALLPDLAVYPAKTK